jgi:hypothetical protein
VGGRRRQGGRANQRARRRRLIAPAVHDAAAGNGLSHDPHCDVHAGDSGSAKRPLPDPSAARVRGHRGVPEIVPALSALAWNTADAFECGLGFRDQLDRGKFGADLRDHHGLTGMVAAKECQFRDPLQRRHRPAPMGKVRLQSPTTFILSPLQSPGANNGGKQHVIAPSAVNLRQGLVSLLWFSQEPT